MGLDRRRRRGAVGRGEGHHGRGLVDRRLGAALGGVGAEAVEGVDGEAVPLARPGRRRRVAVGSPAQTSRPCAAACCRPCWSGRCPTRCRGRRRPGRATSMHRCVPLRRTTASLPLNQLELVWSGPPRARIAGSAVAWARTKASPAATEPVRVIVRPAVVCAVGEELDAVAPRREVDRRAGAVVDLERLVVARPLDVLRDEQVGGRGGRRRDRRHHHGNGHGERTDGDPPHEPTERRSHESSRVQRGARPPVAAPLPHEMRREPNTVAARPRLVGTASSANGG